MSNAAICMPDRLKVSRETWILGAICLIDMISTVLLVHNGKAIEANPILVPFMNRGMMWFVLAKSTLFVGPLFGLEYLRLRKPVFVKRMLRLAIAGYLVTYVLGGVQLNMADQSTLSRVASRGGAPGQVLR